MKLLKNFLTLFLLITLSSCGQEATFQEDVMTYLKSNGTAKQYNYAYDELLKMLGNQFPKTTENATGWDYLEANKEKYVSEMLSLLEPVYVKNFTHEEIKKMNAFYQSEAGKQLVADGEKLTEDQKKEVNDFYGSETGKIIVEKQPVLAAEIGKVSEGWSRDLYETALSMLK
ncbi:DUF2059 domain-containing protein [Cellulophaga sp. HaHa_2_95]|uniref:DUF2059 domain-containing protein n=1 Tax=unclassified Cellulophaga TaxID=2634405 RepID=UPI001C4F333C|nr:MULTISPECIES: DUF2059 domain-containing protein [unclassified Cellulophaga]QXP54011.1 DUF2059 domain-containing protein [Cellulophaga sp. HaHa_2_1]QXP57406.1 DUF2059 domain-containing protein [Cellulophaga sp. HaHa_2_95]